MAKFKANNDTMVYAFVAALIVVILTFVYRTQPWKWPDAIDYLSLGIHRPIGYGAFLRVLQVVGMGGDLRFLPQIQAVLLTTALAFFARAVGRALHSTSVGVAVLVLPWFLPSFAVSVPMMGAEAIFISVVLVAAALCLSPHTDRFTIQLALGVCLGAAVLIRSTGWPVAAAVVVFLFLSLRLRARGFALVVGALFAVWLSGTVVQAAISGRIELKSFGSVSLMGKAALLASRGDPLPEALQNLPEVAAEARALIAEAPTYSLRTRLRFQAYEYLRWKWIWPRAENVWPSWRLEDKTTWASHIGNLAGSLIRTHPLDYMRLVAEDYLALFLWPELVLPTELEGDKAFIGERPQRMITLHCDLSPAAVQTEECWVLLPPTPAVPLWLIVLPFSWLALGISYVVMGKVVLAFARQTARPGAVVLLASLLLQAQAVATAMAEAGLLRYAAPLMPFIVTLALATCLDTARWIAVAASEARRTSCP